MLKDISTGIYLAMGIMALVLILLSIGMLYIINTQKKIMQRIESDDKQQTVKDTAPAAHNLPGDDIDSELVAVIAASVAYVMERPSSSIKVRTIRRIGPDVPSWTLAGRQGQMDSMI